MFLSLEWEMELAQWCMEGDARVKNNMAFPSCDILQKLNLKDYLAVNSNSRCDSCQLHNPINSIVNLELALILADYARRVC